jgi:hypothetical protein
MTGWQDIHKSVKSDVSYRPCHGNGFPCILNNIKPLSAAYSPAYAVFVVPGTDFTEFHVIF